ncbi:MAG: FAD-dependent oxidoreductase [Limnobacter sp.]|uniref:FAD-dependent oxidoreductase n=1 Tax=Limnobacter sp. TaxID=2003368 RepID=UPI00391D1B4B
MMNKRVVLLAVVAALILAWAEDLPSLLTLDSLKARMDGFQALRAEQPWLVAGVYALVYVAVTALSIPGAAILTLAGGALFGLWLGLAIVSVASTVGASLAFLGARYLLRDVVQARFGERLSGFQQGLEKDGAFYLFTLRLVPVVPFFLINLLMGLTRMPLRTFFWVSQLGMLAGTAVYVNAGTELARIESLSGIVSPGLLASFALLGVFPWLARKVLAVLQARRVYAPYSKPDRFDRNLIVIGAGAAGLVTAYIAAAVKAKVTLIEARDMGGDCLNTGCVPSKALIRSARLAQQMRKADQFGLAPTEPNIPFAQVMKRIRQVIRDIEPHDSVERYTSLGVDVVKGYARLIDPWTVSIADAQGQARTLTARHIVLATGAEPLMPKLPGMDEVGVLNSDTLWAAMDGRQQAPARFLVMGGGPIGCELAQAFARLGSAVTLVEMGERLLAREDEEVSALVTEQLRTEGVTVLLGHRVTAFASNPQGREAVLDNHGHEVRVPFDDALCALGRKPRVQGYGLEALGISAQPTIETNEYLQTRFPNILVAGDAAGPYQFTHVAAHQAWYAAVNSLFGHLRKFKVDYRVIPWVTFVDPEVARVGLNETEAKAKGIAYEVVRYGLDDLDRAIADGENHGFVKILTVPGKDVILGATLVGSHAGDLLAELVLAMRHGLGLNKILGTIHPYPTWTESNKYAAGEWKRAHAPQGLLRWVQRYHAWRIGQ